MALRRKPSPLMGAATAMLDGVANEIVRDDSRFRHSFEIAVASVRPDPNQARTSLDQEDIKSLAHTMTEQGQLQPVLVRRDPDRRGKWILVAGERRWRAAQTNGWESMLAIEHNGDAEVVAMIENLQRVDLSVVDEARGLQRLIAGKGWSQAQAAQVMGKSEGEISSTLRVLSLPTDLLSTVLTSKGGVPSRYVLAELARLEPGAARDKLVQAATSGTLTVRMVRAARDQKPEQPIRPSTARSGRHLTATGIKRFSSSLKRLTRSTREISDEERACLQQLRIELNHLLQQLPKPT